MTTTRRTLPLALLCAFSIASCKNSADAPKTREAPVTTTTKPTAGDPKPEPPPKPNVTKEAAGTADGSAPTGWPAHFATMVVKNASFKLAFDDGSDTVLEGTIASATDTAIEIRWQLGGKDANGAMPSTITRKGDTIIIDEVTFVPAGDKKAGDMVKTTKGVTCYTDGPEEDAGDCEDTCFSEICFSDALGVVQLSGNWSYDQDMQTNTKCTNKAGTLSCK